MRKIICAPLCALVFLSACKSASTTMDGVKSAGSAVAQGVGGIATSLVKVDLSNVLNDLALDLKVDKSNIPVNAQIPVTVAANVCGVSINILSIGAGGGSSKGCTANSISPELKQYIQQQIAANGSVGGGAQTNGTTSTTGTNTSATGASTGTTGTTTAGATAGTTSAQPQVSQPASATQMSSTPKPQ
jgi:hypothetical protein